MKLIPPLVRNSALQLSSNRARPFIFSYDTVGSALSHIWVVINAHAPCSDWPRARNMEFITCGVRGVCAAGGARQCSLPACCIIPPSGPALQRSHSRSPFHFTSFFFWLNGVRTAVGGATGSKPIIKPQPILSNPKNIQLAGFFCFFFYEKKIEG